MRHLIELSYKNTSSSTDSTIAGQIASMTKLSEVAAAERKGQRILVNCVSRAYGGTEH